MSIDVDQLYNLLPAIYRIRDHAQGEPLKALLAVMAEQAAALTENLDQLYDDQFIETCADRVAPYIGDLIGYRTLYGVAPRISSPRAEVANTIGFRRRKGTASMLEQLARDVTGWNARAVEFFQLLATTQYMNHIRLGNLATPDLRQWEPLERINTPFDTVAHTADVRRIASSRGKYNIPNVGIFLWRLGAYSLTDSPAFKLKPNDATDQRYLFSPLGYDTPLFNNPVTEDEITHIAEPINAPMPLSRRVLNEYLTAYYGSNKSIKISVKITPDDPPIPASQIRVCNLADLPNGDWAHKPTSGLVAVDPVLGRLAFGDAPATPPLVTFYYGFSADMGGGEYERSATFDPDLQPVQVITMPAKLQDALNVLGGAGVVEIGDSGRYAETVNIIAAAGKQVELRAGNEQRPTLVLGGDLIITGDDDEAVVSLNGLLIAGGAIKVQGKLKRLTIQHCTLAPGAKPSLIVETADTQVVIDQSILGGLRVDDSVQVQISNSIVDATGEDLVAYAALDDDAAGGPLTLINSTVIGKVHTTLMQLVTNTLLLARLAQSDTWLFPVNAERTQEGCVRFSFVSPGSRTPRRFQCQPTSDEDALPGAPRARPQFTSLRYGDAGYGQLSQRCAIEIRTGADDEAEMGAFHDLFQPQRETNLRVRLDEYLRFGLEAGIFYAS